MSNKIDEQKLESLAKELAKGVKTEQDVADLSRTLLKMTVETDLGAAMEAHLGYAPHEATGRNAGNSRNGHSTKRLKGDHGEVEITTPRPRRQLRAPDDAQGPEPAHPVRRPDPVAIRQGPEHPGHRGSVPGDVRRRGLTHAGVQVTEAVLERVEAWQSRPLEGLYPIVYLDGLVVKVR